MEERISIIMGNENLSPTKLAEVLKIQPSNISHLLSGRNKPSLQLLEKILFAFPHISGDWLINGSGEYAKGAKSPVIKPIVKEQSLFSQDDLITSVKPLPEVPKLSPALEPDILKEDTLNSSNILPDAISKAIKIIVFYEDNSFEEFNPRKK